MAEVRIDGLTKVFPDGTVAVEDLDLDIGDGEFLVLLGPSGCGKTTTLRCIAGLEYQTEGDIWIGERLVNDLHPGKRDIAFVFQFYALYPHLNAFDNISFPLRATHVPKDEIERRVREVAKVLQIEHVLRKNPKGLPSGEQQRVALGRAVVRRPHVFLMDEPLTNLDAALRAEMRIELKHLQHQIGTTMLYVTHDQTEAMTMGSRIAIMNRGVLQQVGTPLEVYRHPATLFVAGFIGDPPMNLIPVQLSGGQLSGPAGFSLRLEPDQVKKIEAGRSSSDLVVGARAEDIGLRLGGEDSQLRGEIATREPLGDHNLYSIPFDGRLLQVTTPPTEDYWPGDSVGLLLDPLRVRVFDAGSGDALV